MTDKSLTFEHLRSLLDKVEGELASSFPKPALAPLVALNDLLTAQESQLLADAYEQPGVLTIFAMREIIDRIERQIDAVPNGSSPIRSLLLRMNEVAESTLMAA